MKEMQGDFWELAPNYDAIVCTINNILNNKGELVMGAGIAKQFKDKYLGLSKFWGERVLKNKTRYPDKANLLLISYSISDHQFIIGLPTKYHWKDPSDLTLIDVSCRSLLNISDYLGLDSVLMTRPGCGHGGLKWKTVKNTIGFLDERFTVVNNGS